MRWLAVIAILAACGAPPVAPNTATPPTVSSPGPLIAGHAQLACIDCHVAETAQVAVAKCTLCHTALGERVAARQDMHAKPAVRQQACTDCHLDHRGPRFDTRWASFGGRDRFDHRLAGWKLGKGHRIECVKCHANANADRPSYAGATIACGSCHPQPHTGTPYAKLACEGCHLSAESFDVITYDHELRMPIGSSHSKIACAACHTQQLGTKAPPRACASCHASRDPHGGRFSAFGAPPTCERCHSPTMAFRPGDAPRPWKPNDFDHSQDGRWALTGKHAQITCRACHSAQGTAIFAKLGSGKDCTGCHEHRNVHELKYANSQCVNCHGLPSFH